ncbi:MAG: hypothetical protein K2Q33_02970, partial [Gammaproteobacteria bacterium]|nr:hypothetical protein [Gammaproteobacteria bacterium]
MANFMGQAIAVFIIGFGFDRNNLNILGLPSHGKKYFHPKTNDGLFNNKKIKWLNYKGKLTNIQRELEALANNDAGTTPKLIISTLEYISEAYHNDLKPACMSR